MKDLRGKSALVTGAGSGIGRCIALDLAREGCDVVLVDIDESGLLAAAAEIERAGGKATACRVDVSDPDQVGTLARDVAPQVLVNCAGVGILADLEDTRPEDWDRILGVNLFGSVNLVRVFLPLLKANGGGHIVNIASGFGLFAFPGFGAYSTSKFALVGYSEALSVELAKYGIKVTTVCPGITDTPILQHSEARGFDEAKAKSAVRRLLPLIATTPERLSRVIVEAVKKEKHLVVHTWLFRLLFFVKRLSPGLYMRVISIPYGATWRLRRETGR